MPDFFLEENQRVVNNKKISALQHVNFLNKRATSTKFEISVTFAFSILFLEKWCCKLL